MDIEQFIKKNEILIVVAIIVLVIIFSNQGIHPLFQLRPYSYLYKKVSVQDDRISFIWWSKGWGTPINPRGNRVVIHTLVEPYGPKNGVILTEEEYKQLIEKFDFTKYYPCNYTGEVRIRCYFDLNNRRITDGYRTCAVEGGNCKVRVKPEAWLCVRGTNCEKKYYTFSGDAYITITPENVKGISISGFCPSIDVKIDRPITLYWDIPRKTVEFTVIISEMGTDIKIANATCNLDGYTGVSDINGEIKFNVPPGDYTLVCNIPDHEMVVQDIEVTPSGGWIGIATPKLKKTCEDYGYMTNPPTCEEGETPEIVNVDNMTCYTGECVPAEVTPTPTPTPPEEETGIYYVLGAALFFIVVISILLIIYYRKMRTI